MLVYVYVSVRSCVCMCVYAEILKVHRSQRSGWTHPLPVSQRKGHYFQALRDRDQDSACTHSLPEVPSEHANDLGSKMMVHLRVQNRKSRMT
jgi:hypothetical protein